MTPWEIGAIIAGIIAVVVVIWVFVDSGRKGDPATIFKAVTTATAVLGLPGLLLALLPAQQIDPSTDQVLIYLGVAAGALALLLGLLYLAGVGRSRPTAARTTFINEKTVNIPVEREPAPPTSPGAAAPLRPTEASAAPAPTQYPATPLRGQTELLQRTPRQFAWLVALNGPYAGHEFALNVEEGGEILIGRSGELSQIVLDDPTVSETHAKVVLRNGQFMLSDMGSRNGLLVNGQPTLRHTLADHDTLALGQTRLVFIEVREARGVPTSVPPGRGQG